MECFDLSKTADWEALEQAAPRVILLGFESDEGVFRNNGRIGAKAGPDKIREKFLKLPRHFCGETFKIADGGNISCDGDLEASQILLGERLAKILSLNIMPIVLGGGHETAFGTYLGLHSLNDHSLGIINFDAHLDMRPLDPAPKVGTSGTPFLQIAELRKKNNLPFRYSCLGMQMTANSEGLLKTLQTWDVKSVFARDCFTQPDRIKDLVDYNIRNFNSIYLSICLDVFAEAFSPGVSAPSAHGLMPWQVILPLQQLAKSGKVVSLDIVELAPNLDEGQKTARLAATLLAEFLYYLK